MTVTSTVACAEFVPSVAVTVREYEVASKYTKSAFVDIYPVVESISNRELPKNKLQLPLYRSNIYYVNKHTRKGCFF